jgi:hypothetical protein
LKPICNKLLSSCAFDFNLRRYTKVRLGPAGAEEVLPMVGPCSLKLFETCVESAWFQRLKL